VLPKSNARSTAVVAADRALEVNGAGLFVVAGVAADDVILVFTAAEALTIAGAFVDFAVFVGAHVLIRHGAKALCFGGKVSFGLGVLKIEERVVLVVVCVFVGLGI
jgi:predicted thioesterase